MSGTGRPGPVFLTGFDAFVCEGDAVTGTQEGFALTARIAYGNYVTSWGETGMMANS